MTKLKQFKETITDDVRIVAVSKTRTIEEIAAMYNEGQLDFGENRVQELLMKAELLRDTCPDINWHLIGTLQRNKVNQVCGLVSCIQSVNSIKLLEQIDRAAKRLDIRQDVLLQINYSGETSKHGFTPEDAIDALKTLDQWQNIRVRGLMTMARFGLSTKEKLSFFNAFHDYYTELKDQYGFDTLSMGMSGDYKEAIQSGSTMVRIGTALFGPRS